MITAGQAYEASARIAESASTRHAEFSAAFREAGVQTDALRQHALSVAGIIIAMSIRAEARASGFDLPSPDPAPGHQPTPGDNQDMALAMAEVERGGG